MVETYGSGYTLDSGSKLFLYSWEKTSGGTDTIVGTYNYDYTVQTVMQTWNGSGWDTSSDATVSASAEITYNSDNSWSSSVVTSISPDNGTTDPGDMYPMTVNNSGTWDEASTAAYCFVSYDSRSFLYTGDASAYILQ